MFESINQSQDRYKNPSKYVNQDKKETIDEQAQELNLGAKTSTNMGGGRLIRFLNSNKCHYTFYTEGFYLDGLFYTKDQVKNVIFVVNGQSFTYNTGLALLFKGSNGNALAMQQSNNASYKLIIQLKNGEELSIRDGGLAQSAMQERVERFKDWFKYLDESKNNNDNDGLAKIKEAKELLDIGAITETEFNELKIKLLSKL